MTNSIQGIMSSGLGHKEKVTAMTEIALMDKKALTELFEILKTGHDVDKGTAAEAMKFVSKENPDKMVPYIDLLIEYIDYKTPRVRWGCPESLGYIARKHPDDVGRAIPKLLGNLEDKSTVVRWCAAFALTEIAKNNHEKQKDLVTTFNHLIKKEQNNGVRNLYVNAIKDIDNQKIGG
jgi:hypothetical protein